MGEGFYPIGSIFFSAGVAGIVLGVKALIRLALPNLSELKLALEPALCCLC